mgnify:FL=1
MLTEKIAVAVPSPLRIKRRMNIEKRTGFTIWRGPEGGRGLEGDKDVDKRSYAITHLDVHQIAFEHFLREDESSIERREKLCRIEDDRRIGYDAQIGFTLLEEPEQKTLH